MATLNTGGLPTLLDLARRTAPDGSIEADIVEQMMKQNPAMEDAVWVEGNLPTGHQVTSRTGLPTPTWRRFNEGVTPDKSITDQFTETCGMLSGLSKVDCDVAELNGGMAYRASEDDAWLQGVANEFERAVFYESIAANPERIQGFTTRLNATSGNNAANQIVKHTSGASGNDQTSMWLVAWSPRTVFCITPKGSRAGISSEDQGKQLTRDANNKEFFSWVTEWKFKPGICVKDWRGLVRGCNIDTSALDTTADDLVPLMIKMYHRIPRFIRQQSRLVFYANRTITEALHLQARVAVKGSTLAIQNIGGEEITTCLGVPVHEADALVNTEAVVT